MAAMRIGIVLFEDAEELDWAGPWEVFTMAAMGQQLEVVTIAEREAPVRCAKGLRVLPDFIFENAPPLDVVLVPGGKGSRVEMENPVLLDWLARVAAKCTYVTSVCTGAAILYRAGLAKDCEVTTHWAYIETLRELAPDLTVRENVRFVASGNLVTSAGVSAGIDMALWLVGQIYGSEHADNTQRMMEYGPTQ